MAENKSIYPGTLDMLILGSLSNGEKHGWSISKWLEDHSNNSLTIPQGSLYPALHKLERKGLIRADWHASEEGRRAKFYHLTNDGRVALKLETQRWERFVDLVGRIIAPSKPA